MAVLADDNFDPGRESNPAFRSPQADISLNADFPAKLLNPKFSLFDHALTSDVVAGKIVVTPARENTWIIHNIKTKEALVVDPGGEGRRVMAVIAAHDLKISAIWLTHSHPDHCGGAKDIHNSTGAPLYAHPHWMERLMRHSVPLLNYAFGIKDPTMRNSPFIDVHIRGGEMINFSGLDFKVLHTPGHSPGHVSFYSAAAKTLIAGDLIFRDSWAITSIPGANAEVFDDTISRLLSDLPGDTTVLAGHQGVFTIADWRKNIESDYLWSRPE